MSEILANYAEGLGKHEGRGISLHVAETVRIDLHCHSSASDGDHSPANVARRLADIGVAWASLTDHNTVAGQDEFRTALERYGIGYIPGVEIDARSTFGPLHVLAYQIDLHDKHLLAILHTVRRPWRSSMRRLLSRVRLLREPSPLPPTPCALEGDAGTLKAPLSTADAICLIHQAGGLAFLAHPLESLRSFKRIEETLDQLQPEGLDGIEVFHRSYPEGVQYALLALAVRRGLVPTGGSDFHGLHHSDGASLGVDIPRGEWNKMLKHIGVTPRSLPSAAS
jgi:predicted metal-dependent phosphoesterase TrpH